MENAAANDGSYEGMNGKGGIDGGAEAPNMLFLMVDQQRYDCIGYSRDYPVSTPNIDKLAEGGVWFDQAFTPIPLCCPARQALLAGRRPESLGLHWNYGSSLAIPALEPTEYVWTRDLTDRGYRMGYVGKWHVHPKYDPTAYGYEDYVSERDYGQFRKSAYPEVKYDNGFYGERDPLPLEHTRTHWLAAEAVRLMEKYDRQGGPWHIRFDLTEPHLPCRPAGRFADMYKPEDVPMWRSFTDTLEGKPYIQKQMLYNWRVENYGWDDWAPIVARYYGQISQVDDALGLVLGRLEELGLRENTIVVFTTDHGDLCGGHRMMDKHYVMYEDVVRVPMIVNWPGKFTPGLRCSEMVYNLLDLPPTLLELAGIPADRERLHGRSLVPLLEGEQPEDWRKAVVSTYNGQQFGLYTQRMLRDSRWKYIWNTTDMDELYDLENDPDELVNLIGDTGRRDMVAGMRAKLYEELVQAGDGLVNNQWMKDQLLNSRKL